MHLGEKLAVLHQRFGEIVEVLERTRILWIIPFTRRHGWISIEDEEDHWAVLWTSSRNTHDPLFRGPAIGADVLKTTGSRMHGGARGLNGAWRSAISMWPARDEEEAAQIFRNVEHLVDLAHTFYVTRPWIAKPDIIPNVRG